MRITELVKTYRLLSDPEAPAWNVKFVGALAVVAAVALGVGGIYWATAVEQPAEGPATFEATQPGPDGSRVDYVGFPPGAASVDPAALEAALEAWKAAHPGATILSQEPSYAATGEVAGYAIRYLP